MNYTSERRPMCDECAMQEKVFGVWLVKVWKPGTFTRRRKHINTLQVVYRNPAFEGRSNWHVLDYGLGEWLPGCDPTFQAAVSEVKKLERSSLFEAEL